MAERKRYPGELNAQQTQWALDKYWDQLQIQPGEDPAEWLERMFDVTDIARADALRSLPYPDDPPLEDPDAPTDPASGEQPRRRTEIILSVPTTPELDAKLREGKPGPLKLRGRVMKWDRGETDGLPGSEDRGSPDPDDLAARMPQRTCPSRLWSPERPLTDLLAITRSQCVPSCCGLQAFAIDRDAVARWIEQTEPGERHYALRRLDGMIDHVRTHRWRPRIYELNLRLKKGGANAPVLDLLVPLRALAAGDDAEIPVRFDAAQPRDVREAAWHRVGGKRLVALGPHPAPTPRRLPPVARVLRVAALGVTVVAAATWMTTRAPAALGALAAAVLLFAATLAGRARD